MRRNNRSSDKGARVCGLWVSALIAALSATLPTAQGQTPSPTPLQRTMSTSGEFAVFGATPTIRLAVARRADELFAGWKSALALTGEKQWPIVINLTRDPARRRQRAHTALFLADGETLKIQIDLPEDSAAGADLEIEVIRALALEFAYRKNRPAEGKSYTAPPDWLVEGVWQEITAKESGFSAKLFDRLVDSGPPPKLEAFIRQRPETMDPISRAVYRAQAMTLLRALAATEGGHAGIAEYLSGLKDSRRGDASAILAAFPTIEKDPSALIKLWTLAMAKASTSDRVEMFSALETEARLEEILRSLKLPTNPKDPESTILSGPEAIPALSREEAGRYLLRRASEELLRLEGRAHPLYRPIVEEYRSVVSDLAVRRRRGSEKRLAAAGQLRAVLTTRVGAIADTLNWFEASQLETPSEAFPETFGETLSLSSPQRNDAISQALDEAERNASR